MPGVAIYFTSLEVMQSILLEGGNKPLDPWQALVVAASARSVAGVLLMPFTVIKTRFEVTILDIYSFDPKASVKTTLTISSRVGTLSTKTWRKLCLPSTT